VNSGFLEELARRTLERISAQRAERVALLGFTPAAIAIRARLSAAELGSRVLGVFDRQAVESDGEPRPLAALPELAPDLLVVCADAEKEELLLAYREAGGERGQLPEVVLAGTAHLAFHDPLFAELDAPALVPSYATGSPHTRIHLFQCLKAAAENGLHGAIVEFGAFKGGTTAWLARAAQRLGLRDVKVIGFDTWAGFPERRSLLDLYKHPRCVFDDVAEVRAYTEPYGVELVQGDISETYRRLQGEPLLLCFFDTDNYSPTRAALELCVEQLVAGGAIVFDHVATTPDYIDTLGERIAAFEVLGDRGFMNLHATGVFVKLR
jgi:O-methyltransferase